MRQATNLMHSVIICIQWLDLSYCVCARWRTQEELVGGSSWQKNATNTPMPRLYWLCCENMHTITHTKRSCHFGTLNTQGEGTRIAVNMQFHCKLGDTYRVHLNNLFAVKILKDRKNLKGFLQAIRFSRTLNACHHTTHWIELQIIIHILFKKRRLFPFSWKNAYSLSASLCVIDIILLNILSHYSKLNWFP